MNAGTTTFFFSCFCTVCVGFFSFSHDTNAKTIPKTNNILFIFIMLLSASHIWFASHVLATFACASLEFHLSETERHACADRTAVELIRAV